jgi:hypothetical protein
MDEDNPSKTDAELVDMLDELSGWMVRAGVAAAVPQGNLRAALIQAFHLSRSGSAITNIVKLPEDAIVVSATQIGRLWWRLGLLDN